MDQEKPGTMLLCTNCSKYFNADAAPSFKAALITKDKVISIAICPHCMERPYILNDRIIKMAFKQLGQQETFTKV